MKIKIIKKIKISKKIQIIILILKMKMIFLLIPNIPI